MQDLLKTEKVQAIIGPLTSMQANFLIHLGEEAHVPILSFSATSPSLSSLRSPYFFRAALNDSSQVQPITSIIQAFGWKEVVPIYIENEYGEGLIPFLTNAFQEIEIRVPYKSTIHPSANDEEIVAELYKLMTMQTHVFVVHMTRSLSDRLFTKANEIGMMSEGYVWIITDGITNSLNFFNHSVIIDSMQGVIGVKPHTLPFNRSSMDSEGFVKMSSTQQPEDIADKYLKELVHRNMIEIVTRKEDRRHKTCRMPSFLHDFFFQKSEVIGFIHAHHCRANCTPIDSTAQLNTDSPADQPNTDSSAQNNIDLLAQPNNVCLSDVCFKAQTRGPSNEKINELLKTIIDRRGSRGFVLTRVLDLEGAHRPLLHAKLGKFLSNLRYISLRWTGIDSCPKSIGDLPCLETLDLKYTNITNLSSSIWKAKNLRHLLMNEVSIPKPSSSKQSSTSMSNIQTLTGLRIGFEDPKEYGLNRFTSLRKLGLTCHSRSSVEKTWDCISQRNKLQTFKLRSRDHQFGQPLELVIPDNLTIHPSLSNLYLFGVFGMFEVRNLPQNLKTLTLSMSKIKEDPMPELGQFLPQLNILRLFADSFVGEKMNCLGGGFPKLRVLKLWTLETLKEWIVEEGAMPELEELEIRGCEKLEKSQGLERLSHLKELTLTNMKREFVDDVKQNLASVDRSHILLTNKFKSSTTLALCIPSHVQHIISVIRPFTRVYFQCNAHT
ncbi:hypothetical protein TEA_001363 [Camellia sinensis var. sinensis]|uniref:Uncharacterized protein n=1 Tax=Camellia sinensis var. sinensis TaxID=542762 RepID=A0A4S4DE59_CAMSN|nr:hypothetical protein TEA_001363 [Camellia sinensis var. sinensis]